MRCELSIRVTPSKMNCKSYIELLHLRSIKEDAEEYEGFPKQNDNRNWCPYFIINTAWYTLERASPAKTHPQNTSLNILKYFEYHNWDPVPWQHLRTRKCRFRKFYTTSILAPNPQNLGFSWDLGIFKILGGNCASPQVDNFLFYLLFFLKV